MDIVKGLLILGLVVALFAFMPVAVIWSLNTLFGLSIVLTGKTWLAALVLSSVVGSSKVQFKTK